MRNFLKEWMLPLLFGAIAAPIVWTMLILILGISYEI